MNRLERSYQEMTVHEKFMRGEPLTEDLAAIREGRDPQPATRSAAPERKAWDDPARELSRAERVDLKEWKEMPGWELFLRIAEKSVQAHQKRAISLSQDDPLNNRDAIAEAWAYVKIFRRAVVELENVVTAEVAELERT